MLISTIRRIAFIAMCATASCAWAAPEIIENTLPGGLPEKNELGDLELPEQGLLAGPRSGAVPVVWEMPRLQDRIVKLRVAMAVLYKQGKFAEAEKACQQSIRLVPHEPGLYYILASSQARQGKSEAALDSLSKAVELGFNKSQLMQRDPSFAALQTNERFLQLIAESLVATPNPSPWQRSIVSKPVHGKEAVVSASNTGWDSKHGVFVSLFKLPPNVKGDVAVQDSTALHRRINEWYRQGTAAGNYGDLYDNHDGDHSTPRLVFFPQMTRIKFSEDARRRNYHTGLQTRFFYNGVVIGNSSTAMVRTPYWRSQPRLGYVDKRSVGIMYLQYVKNHLYVYPEHRDHDPEHGDVFPANTPYIVVTQGSSGSDRPVLEAMGYALAAMHPDVKQFLAANGALMPTLQMIFRLSQNAVQVPDDYLTGKAHPTVFSTAFSASRMATSAHQLEKGDVPPLVRLQVVEDDASISGRDFFDHRNNQELFTTPCAIARVHRTTNQNYRMVVSAQQSKDLNGRDITYHWKVLRGDARKIKIKPLNDEASVVELQVGWQPKQPIAPGSKMESSRVDIGCFAHNGALYSAPAFVTFFTLANERRSYRPDGQIATMQYQTGGPYVDPLVDTPKNWTDTYRYHNDRRIGWTRERDGVTQEFTADGAIVLKRDGAGRPTVARTAKYSAFRADPKRPPVLQQTKGAELVYYDYLSSDDRIGRIIKREPAP